MACEHKGSEQQPGHGILEPRADIYSMGEGVTECNKTLRRAATLSSA